MAKRAKSTQRKSAKPKRPKTERGYADNIAIAVIAGIIIMIAIFYAVAKLGQVSAPSLPNPSPTPSPSPTPIVSATPSPTDSAEPTPSPVSTSRATPTPTRLPQSTASPSPNQFQ